MKTRGKVLAIVLSVAIGAAVAGCTVDDSSSYSYEAVSSEDESSQVLISSEISSSSEVPSEVVSAQSEVSSAGVSSEEKFGTEDAVYQATLTPGNYEVGVDIPSGGYTIDVVSGEEGTVHNSSGEISFIANSHSTLQTGSASFDPIKTYYGAILNDGDVLTVNAVTVAIYNLTTKGSLSQVENTEGASVTLSSGNYTVGQDIQPGVYDAEIVAGDGVLKSVSAGLPSDGVQLSTDEVLQAMGVSATYKNINFTSGRTFQISPISGNSPSIKFVPSKYQHTHLV